MSAMKIIDKVHAEGGKVLEFTSYCGGLPCPEDNNNPYGYKFSWSPRGVLLAAIRKQASVSGKWTHTLLIFDVHDVFLTSLLHLKLLDKLVQFLILKFWTEMLKFLDRDFLDRDFETSGQGFLKQGKMIFPQLLFNMLCAG